MRRMVVFLPIIAALLLAGCLSDKDWEKIEGYAISQAYNDTVNNLNPFKPPCEAGTICKAGRLMEVKCDNGKEVSSVVALPYSCKGKTLITSTCTGNQLSQGQSSGLMHCNARGYLEDVSCTDEGLNRNEIGEYMECKNDGSGNIDRTACSFGNIYYTTEYCDAGTACKGTPPNAQCS